MSPSHSCFAVAYSGVLDAAKYTVFSVFVSCLLDLFNNVHICPCILVATPFRSHCPEVFCLLRTRPDQLQAVHFYASEPKVKTVIQTNRTPRTVDRTPQNSLCHGLRPQTWYRLKSRPESISCLLCQRLFNARDCTCRGCVLSVELA